MRQWQVAGAGRGAHATQTRIPARGSKTLPCATSRRWVRRVSNLTSARGRRRCPTAATRGCRACLLRYGNWGVDVASQYKSRGRGQAGAGRKFRGREPRAMDLIKCRLWFCRPARGKRYMGGLWCVLGPVRGWLPALPWRCPAALRNCSAVPRRAAESLGVIKPPRRGWRGLASAGLAARRGGRRGKGDEEDRWLPDLRYGARERARRRAA